MKTLHKHPFIMTVSSSTYKQLLNI